MPVITGLLADSDELASGEGRDYKRSFVCLAHVEMTAPKLCGIRDLQNIYIFTATLALVENFIDREGPRSIHSISHIVRLTLCGLCVSVPLPNNSETEWN